MGFTDFLDGFIARNFNYATVLGTYLDPFADKVFISIMSLTLWYIGALPGVLVGLWVVRDVGMFSTAYWMVRSKTLERSKINGDSDGKPVTIMDPTKTPLKVEANFLSKVNTTLQIGLIALGIAGEVPSIEIPSEFTTILWYMHSSLYIYYCAANSY
jgi:cardiolipin synthase